jgi:RsiW-degrading membrane proteinase PrsW (M82 family)
MDSYLSCQLPAGIRLWNSILVAPPVEEGLKLLGAALIAFMMPHAMSRMMGALLCGSLIGLGTALAENWGYATTMISNAPGGGEKVRVIVQWLVERGVVEAPWSHSTFSTVAALGVTLSLAWTGRGQGVRFIVAVGAFFLAVLLHASHNAGATDGKRSGESSGTAAVARTTPPA